MEFWFIFDTTSLFIHRDPARMGPGRSVVNRNPSHADGDRPVIERGLNVGRVQNEYGRKRYNYPAEIVA